MACLVDNKMTPIDKVVTVKLTDTIRVLKSKLRHNAQRAAIVLGPRNKVEGVITATDLLFASDDNFVEDWYKSPAYVITPDRPIEVARQILDEHGNHQLVVVNAKMEPLGILWDYDAILGCGEDDVPEEPSSDTVTKKKVN